MRLGCLFLLSVFLFSPATFSNTNDISKPVRWVTDSWPNYTNQDGTGLYHELMRSIFYEANEFNVQYAPWLRSLELVKSGGADLTGAMPLNPTFIMSKHIVLSQPISLLVRKDRYAKVSESDLPKLVGVWRSGYKNELLNDTIKPLVNGVETENTESGFNLVRYKRVDYLIDIRTILATHLANQPDKAEFQLIDISSLNLYMAFSNSVRGQYIANLFDMRFSELEKSGRLSEIYQKYQQVVPKKL